MIKKEAIEMERPTNKAKVRVLVSRYPPSFSVIIALIIAPNIGPVIETIPKYMKASF